jgi:hypothetical protein
MIVHTMFVLSIYYLVHHLYDHGKWPNDIGHTRTACGRRTEERQVTQAGDTGPRETELAMAEFLVMSEDERAALIDDSIEERKARTRRIRPVKADGWDRAGILRVASLLTSACGDAGAVEANARVLLAWVQAADSRDDLELRCKALHQQSCNEGLADDNPNRFLAEAWKLYDFMTSQEG